MVGSNGLKTTLIVFAVFLACTGVALWAAGGEALQSVPLGIDVLITAIIGFTIFWFAAGIGMTPFPEAKTVAARTKHALEDR